MRDHDKKHFEKAIAYDNELRKTYADVGREYPGPWSLEMSTYIHRSGQPLEEVDLDNEEDKGQMQIDFGSECDGVCGV